MLIAAKVYADAAKSNLIWKGTVPFCPKEESDPVILPHGIELIPRIHQYALELVKTSNNKIEGTIPIQELISFDLVEKQEQEQEQRVAYCTLELMNREDQPIESNRSFDNCLQLKIERAIKYRLDGNEAFQKNQYTLALKLYQRGLQWLEMTTLVTKKELSLEQVEIPIRINMATCYWKLEVYVKCISQCAQVLKLNPNHIKALYRRSQAYVHEKEFDLAIEDLEKALSLEEEPTARFKTSLEKARTLRNEHQKKQHKAFSRMFQ